MSAILQNLSTYNAADIPDAAAMSFGIVVADYNSDITYPMLQGCIETLLAHGANENNIHLYHVPGSFELPLAALALYERKKPDAVICLGCVITGETRHDEYINKAVSDAIMKLGLVHKTPFIFGVLTPQNHRQALDRAGGKHGNKGIEAAVTAIKMVQLVKGDKNKNRAGFITP
ncbi:MAG TPA: 6,7-dimethyl-8-ribityllumazine synthase [Chitinophagales bacterium]|nr:6,7-dimethyl-8-ribityllumazine synthase [Chitinophagales bacterium]HRK29020.1 6,7-dimethyl-8-ribityllumazine synthase [Chitinophagales bacterium]